MTFIQALYGSQYYELSQKGRDGAKGRFNGNIFLCAFIVLIVLALIAVAITTSSSLADKFNSSLEHAFGGNSGKSIGKLLAIPFMAICYLVVSTTVGSEKNYNRIIEEFKNLPDDQKNRANKKVLVPFFIVLVIFFVLLMSSLSNQ